MNLSIFCSITDVQKISVVSERRIKSLKSIIARRHTSKIQNLVVFRSSQALDTLSSYYDRFL